MTERADVGELKLPSTGFWRSLFKMDEVTVPLADPLHCDAPMLRHAEIAAVYSGQRVAGDFYEFLRVAPSRMLFVLLDIAGLRADTREILIAMQKTFRTLAPELLSGEDFNETTAMIELCSEMNLTILRGGLRSCPAFIGCYNEDLGTVCYANAGHTPGLLRDNTGITLLEATGLPLGLFSHTMQSAASCHLLPGSALLVVFTRNCRSGLCSCSRGPPRRGPPGSGIWCRICCGIRTGRGEAKLSARDRSQCERTLHEYSAGSSEVHTDDSHTQRPNDAGAGAECARRS